MNKTAGDLLYRATIERGGGPLVRAHHQLPGTRAPLHVSDRPSVSWCRACRRVVVRGMGRWWE
jgi:hypothetical protein